MLKEKLNPKKDDVIQWCIKSGDITTNIIVKIYFTLPELSLTKIVTWYCHVDDFAKSGYYMISGRYILTAFGSNLKLSKHVVKADGGSLKGSSAPVLDLGVCEFKDLNTG